MTKRIVYFHGFRGSPQSKTREALTAGLPGCEVVAVTIDHAQDPSITEASLDHQLVTLTDDSDDLLFIGNSAGAYWARHFASMRGYDCDVVLINPSLDPATNLRKYDLDESILAAYLVHQTNYVLAKKVHVFVGDKDDVVDHTHIDKNWAQVTHLPDEGHKIVDMTPVINTIKEKFMT